MTVRQRYLWAALLGLVVLGSVLLVWNLTDKQQLVTPAPEKTSSAGQITWRAGESLYYDVHMASSVRMQLAPDSGAQSLPVKLTATLAVYALQSSHIETLVGMRLSNVTLELSGENDTHTAATLKAPFRVKYRSAGIPEAFEFAQATDAQARAMLENLVRTFQVSIHASANSWDASEANATGRYTASYRRSPDAQNSSVQIEKQKSAFQAAPSAPMLKRATINSEEVFVIDSSAGWLTSMNVTETIKTPDDSLPTVQIYNRSSLTRSNQQRNPMSKQPWQFTAAAPGQTSPSNVATPEMSPEEAERELLAELSQLDASTEGRITHIHALRDLLQQRDELSTTLLRQMQTEAFTDRTRADLYLALELAGTQAAQAALRSVMVNPEWSTKDGMRAIVALAGVGNPSSETLDELWQTAGSDHERLASTATFALGSLGSTLKSSDSTAYSSVRDGLLNGALSSADAERKKNYLLALGNTRDPDLAYDVATLLQDPNAQVRRAAAQSLGVLDNPGLVTGLVAQLERENKGEVRAAIAESLNTLSSGDKATVNAVAAALGTEQDEPARLYMTRFLGKHLSDYPQNRKLLRDILRHEPSKRVRQAIGEALANTP